LAWLGFLTTLACNATGAIFLADFSVLLPGFNWADSGLGFRTAAGFVTFFAAFVDVLGNWVLALLPPGGTTIFTF
jgi:hypothetical protein